jgi:phosphoribosylformylglycinamidine synthase
VALSVGINPNYGLIDPYWMAWAVIDEAVRNAVCVGADPDQLALLDNFCWGNPNLPDRLGGLVRCARGCHDAAVAFGAPFISGKDSLNNEYTGADGDKHAIPGTLLVSALGIVPDITRTATMDPGGPGEVVYVLGMTSDELGGSALYELHGHVGNGVPRPVDHARPLARALHKAIVAGQVAAVHDASEGGLLVSLAEMAMAGRVGLEVDLAAVPWDGAGRSDTGIAFSESLARYVVTVAADQAAAFEAGLAGLPHAKVGMTTYAGTLSCRGLSGAEVVHVGVEQLLHAWRGHVA